MTGLEASFGLYVHWPFCQSKCPYCDFNSHVQAIVDQEQWQRALCAEIRRYGQETAGRTLETIYFGGGTPSLMAPELVAAVIETARNTWRAVNDLEITLEANPTSVETGRFVGYRDAGVNRVSLGVQALDDKALAALGRRHSVQEALTALETARSIFDRTSFDLIYARQGQSLEQWRKELMLALSLANDHLSLYQLTIEDGTAFGDRAAIGRLPGLPSEDLGADMFELTQDLCEAAGMPAYEVSNHARDGFESRHNLIYWRGGDYVGIGPGAHGRLTLQSGRVATETFRSPAAWLEAAMAKGSGESVRLNLSPQDRANEYLLMSLRTREGLNLAHYRSISGTSPSQKTIQGLQDLGLIEESPTHLRTTRAGRMLLNAVLRELVEA